MDTKEADQEAGDTVAGALAARSRVLTGRMRASWRAAGGRVSNGTEYAVYVDAAYPFVADSIAAATAPVVGIYEDHIEKALDHVHGHY